MPSKTAAKSKVRLIAIVLCVTNRAYAPVYLFSTERLANLSSVDSTINTKIVSCTRAQLLMS